MVVGCVVVPLADWRIQTPTRTLCLAQLFNQGGFSGAVRQELGRAEHQGLRGFVVRVWQVTHRLRQVWTGFAEGFAAAIEQAQPVFEDFATSSRERGGEIGRVITAVTGSATAQPARCSLVNVSTGEAMECWLNPNQLAEKVQVNWSRLAIPGLSHQVLQYLSTGNRQLPGVEFYLDGLLASEPQDDRDILAFRALLLSLTVPPAETPVTAPPRTLVIWPKVMTIEAVLTEVEFQYRQFALDGSVLLYTATANFEQILDVRVTSEQLREGR